MRDHRDHPGGDEAGHDPGRRAHRVNFVPAREPSRRSSTIVSAAHSPDFMLATVDALLPLSLLEAVRNVDTPADSFEAEYVDELRNKRLGLSDTIYSQIRRHTEAVRRNKRIPQEEAIALEKLIGRRPDAEAIFRAAGKYLAHESYLTISPAATASAFSSPAKS